MTLVWSSLTRAIKQDLPRGRVLCTRCVSVAADERSCGESLACSPRRGTLWTMDRCLRRCRERNLLASFRGTSAAALKHSLSQLWKACAHQRYSGTRVVKRSCSCGVDYPDERPTTDVQHASTTETLQLAETTRHGTGACAALVHQRIPPYEASYSALAARYAERAPTLGSDLTPATRVLQFRSARKHDRRLETRRYLEHFARGFADARVSPSVLVLAEHARGNVAPATWAALRAAQQVCGGTLSSNGNDAKQTGHIEVLVFDRVDSDMGAVLKQLAQVDGVSRLVLVCDGHCRYPVAEMLAPVIARWSAEQGYSHVFTGGSTFGKNILPRAAGILGIQPLSDIMQVCSPWEFVRPLYAGSILARVRLVPPSEPSSKTGWRCWATIRGTAFEAAQLRHDDACPTELDITDKARQYLQDAAPPAVEWLQQTGANAERPRLESAHIVVTGGRGLRDAEHFQAFVMELADRLGAAVGATRAAVDAGMCANELQVGQTGKVVAPELYIAVGVSGAVQHLAGMKDSKVIIAINNDPEAPIFQAADYGLVGDLFEIMPALLEKLSNSHKK